MWHNSSPASRSVPAGAAVLSMLAVLAGCGVPNPPGDVDEYFPPPAPVAGSHDCPARNPGSAGYQRSSAADKQPAVPPAPQPGLVPEDFVPVSVVRCSMSIEGIEDPQGRWSAVLEEHLRGDLRPLLTALSLPSDRGTFDLACTDDFEVVPDLWLLDAAGRAVLAAWPVDACGKTKPGVRQAVSELSVTETLTHKVTLLEPRAALDAGCPAAWKAPVPGVAGGGDGVGAPDGADARPGSIQGQAVPGAPPPLPHTVDSMRACWYRVAVEPADPADPAQPGPDSAEGDGQELPNGTATPGTGHFAAGRMLDEMQGKSILRLAGTASGAPVCPVTPSSFVVLWPLVSGQSAGGTLTAEMDGCRRLLLEDGRAAALTQEVAGILATR